MNVWSAWIAVPSVPTLYKRLPVREQHAGREALTGSAGLQRDSLRSPAEMDVCWALLDSRQLGCIGRIDAPGRRCESRSVGISASGTTARREQGRSAADNHAALNALFTADRGYAAHSTDG